MACENELQPGFGKAGETLLVMGVEWAEVVAETILGAASAASKPETSHLRLVGGCRER